jgi:hypothetical protein
MELIGALTLPKWNWRSKMKHDPILSPSTLIGSFGRELEGLGLSQGRKVGS